MGCILCERSREPGWLCAEHQGEPWEHDGCMAEGAPCACNREGLLDLVELYAASPDYPAQ